MREPDISTQTIFCESARNEANGQTTLLGIFPDNVNVTRKPMEEGQAAAIASLCAYIRTRLPLDRQVMSSIIFRFRSPTGQMIFENVLDQGFIEGHIRNAQKAGNEFVMLITQLQSRPFPVLEEGRYVLKAEYGGQEHFSGALRLMLVDPPESTPPAPGTSSTPA